jgi:hypothetical protein
MIRSSLLALSLLMSLIFVVGRAYAADPLYRASLEKPAAARLIVRDISWSCAGAACEAPRTATAPDANVCASVARKLGRLASFQAGGRTFEAAELERCNAAAR